MKLGPYLLIAACLCLAIAPALADTVGNLGISSSENGSPALPDQYILPVGGFGAPYTYAGPNSSLDLTYTFYSRTFGPGNVTYTITATDYYGPASEDTVKISIDNASFTAMPEGEYVSHIHVVTGPAFGSASEICGPNGCIVSPVNLHMYAMLEGNATHFCNDTFRLYSNRIIIPGQPAVTSDYFRIMNETEFSLEPGETREISLEFSRGGGIANISYLLSDTALNVTVTPPWFIARHWIPGGYPATLTVHAGDNIAQGNYSFTVNAIGAQGISTYSHEFFVNVSSGAGSSGPVVSTPG